MNAEQMRIACAEEMGWTYCKREVWPKRRPKEFEFVLQSPEQEGKALPEFTVRTASYEQDRILGMDRLPNYLTDADAALTLCDHLAKEGFTPHLTMLPDKSWECIFDKLDEAKVHAAPTMPEAICGAFLRVKGKWNPQTKEEA